MTLRVVTTNNVEVFRHLGAGPFQRLPLEHFVAATWDEALALVRAKRPHIAMIDAELAGGDGCRLSRVIKDDPELRSVHVMMILPPVITRAQLRALEASGCDDVLAPPMHADDFYHHIAQVAGLPLRRERRIGVLLEVLIPGHLPLHGTVENVSASGCGVQVGGVLEAGQNVEARLVHDGQGYPAIQAKVAWTREGADGGVVAGLTFTEVPIRTHILLEQLCLYDVTPAAESGVTVSLYGDFTEITDFTALAARLAGEQRIDFNMTAVRYVSSAGVRAWCQFLATLSGHEYSFRQCSLAFAAQAAMVPMSLGHGVVISLEAPYRCERCDRDELRLLEVKSILVESGHVVPPALRCGQCGGELELDDVPDRYFAFLHRDA